MKLAKKILVAVLALALLASAFLFSATATETFNAPGMDDIEDIYEYYKLEDYLADNYNDGTWTESYVNTASNWSNKQIERNGYQLIDVSATADPTNSENGVFGIKLPYNKYSGYIMEAADKKEGLTDKLFLTFKIYFDESSVNNLFYELKVGTVNEKGVVSVSQFPVLRFNFTPNNGDAGFYYSAWDTATQSFVSELTAIKSTELDPETGDFKNVVPETGKWYDVVVSVNAADDVYYFDVKDLDGNSVVSSGELSFEGAKAIWGFECYGQFLNNTGTDEEVAENKTKAVQYYLDDMEIYEGSYVRYPSRRDEITTTHLQDLDALYNEENTDFETKYRIATVLDYLYNESEDFKVGDAMPNAQKYINETFAQAFVDVVGAIDTASAYGDRVAYLETLLVADAKLPAPESLNGAAGITAELEAAVIAAREVCAEETAALATIKEQSDAFIALMGEYDDTNKNYEYVTKFFADASVDAYAKRDVTYEGVVAANEIYAGLKTKAEVMTADVTAFMTAVADMKASTTFGPLFAAYVNANASYTKYGTDAVINPNLDNSTKEGLDDDITYYEASVEEILATAFICDEFNRIIKEATISSYYTSLVGELEEAAAVREQFGDYEMDYPGIADSVATYEAFVAAVADTKTAVDAYINAVNAIATKTTFAEKKAAITAALALKADGDVLGVEGVVEANVALTAAEAEINILEGNSQTLISLVEQLKAAKTLSQRRALIMLANASAVNAEDTYTGVSTAKADLASAIAAFEADVAAANAALDSALKSAQAVAYCVG